MAGHDAIIVGAGHNGLVAAAYLAKAGRKVLVLEQRPVIGGIAASEEMAPGFKYASCAHLAGSFSKAIVADLELDRQGLEILPLDPPIFAPSLDGAALIIPRDPAQVVEAIGRRSRSDAAKFDSFRGLLQKLCAFLEALYTVPLPSHGADGSFHFAALARAGWKFRRLGREGMHEFLRILPMSAADLLDDWFEDHLLKASIAAAGLFGMFVGPRQQGTSWGLLHHLVGAANGAVRSRGLVRGGIGNLARALGCAAEQAGAEIRTATRVVRITAEGGVARGVVTENGDEARAPVVISSADVKQTFLKLLDPAQLDPEFLLGVKNIRSRGTVAKLNLALDGLPKFAGSSDHRAAGALGGVIHIGPTLDYLERASDDAKYGRFPERPFFEITIPSVADGSLAPPGKHVMSAWIQYAPYHLREAHWDREREALGDLAVDLIEEYAPGFKNLILHRQVLTPLDLEQIYGLTEGHPYHAEMALDQMFFMRPLPGWSAYDTPIGNLYLCGSGTHPGGGVTGLSGRYAAQRILQNWPREK